MFSDKTTRVRICVTVALAATFGVTLTARSQSILVSDTGSGRVLQYAWPSGAFLRTFVNAGPATAPPMGIRIGPNGNLFVAGYDADQVVEYNGTTGAFVRVFIPPGSVGTFNQPVGLAWAPPALAPNGQLFVACFSSTAYRGQCCYSFSGTG